MAKKSSKHEDVVPILLNMTGGLNLEKDPASIEDNELRDATNFIYDPGSDSPVTRPGTDKVSATALGAAIRKIYYYEKSASLAWLMAVSGSDLLRYNATKSVTGFTCDLSTVNGTAFLTNPSTSLASYDGALISLTASGKAITGYVKAAGGGETLGVEIATGTLDAKKLYKITATELDHFGTGLIIDSYFTSAGTETCDASNKVRQVTAPVATGVTIVSAWGGTTYNWTSEASGFAPNSASFTLAIGEWIKVGVVASATVVPSFLTFNTKLLIADGSSDIRRWDGTTYDTIADSPAATALSTIANRVVANASDELDSVYLSGPEDETDWDTGAGDAVGFKAGFGDLLTVNAFGVIGGDLIIFKKGTDLKKTYRVNVDDATPTNWYIKELSANNTAQNCHAVADAWNNSYFIDTNGFKSVKGVEIYGDLQVDPIGKKVNNLFISNTTCDFATYIPKYNTIWFGMGDRVYCYTERMLDGAAVPAFTNLTFKQGRIRSICQVSDTVYLAGNDGFLYKLNESLGTDAGVTYTSTLQGKTFVFKGGGVLKKSQIYLRPLEAGVASFNVNTTKLKDITLPSNGTDLYDATTYLSDATGYLYDESASPWVETSRNRYRDTQMYFSFTATGRVGVEWIKAEFAMVEG